MSAAPGDLEVALGAGPVAGAAPLDGTVDEVRLDDTARSGAWLAAQVANQSAPAAFTTVGAAQAGSWFGAGTWAARTPLTVDAGVVDTSGAGEDLVDFPLLVSITDATVAASAQADGRDLVFTADDGTTRLDHELESWDPATGPGRLGPRPGAVGEHRHRDLPLPRQRRGQRPAGPGRRVPVRLHLGPPPRRRPGGGGAVSPTSTPPTTAVAATAAPGHRTSSLAAVLVLLLAVVVPVRVTLVTSLAAPTVTVNSTDDDADATAGDGLCDTGQLNADGVAECTLRAALEEANASAVDDIAFAVPATDAGNTGGVVTITPASALPPITAATTVDARTQPGWSSTPVVVLDGSLSGAGPGLEVAVGPSVVAGFAVHSFATNGILVLTAADTTIRDNHVGVDETGVAAPGNGAAGVRIDGGAGNVVLDNVVGGNAVGGIAIKQGPDVVVHGNAVGVGTDGTTALGNAGPGIEVAVPNSSNVRIGGTAAGAGNTVAHNTGPGVTLRTGGVGNVSILSNSLHSNGGLGIDLNDDEVTANDPGDGGARGGGRAFDGRIDEVTVSHAARSDAWIAATHATQDQPGAAITVGATQTSASDGWTIDGSQARSGSSAALAPSGVLRSWLTLDGISEGGLEAMSWWRVSSLTGVDVGQGVRAGDAAGSGPVRQDETGLFGPAGWDLGQVDRARTQLVAPPAGQAPAVDTWQRVTVRIDQAAALSATAADTAIPSSGSTPAGVAPTGTIGFRVGSLDPTTRWWIDDLWVRRYVTPEPVATLRRTELAP